MTPRPLGDYWKNILINLIGCPEPFAWLLLRLLIRRSPELVQNLCYGPNEHSPLIKEAIVVYSEIRPLIEYTLGPETL